MEPGNSKHSPRVDDELSHETRSFTQGQPVAAHTRDDLQQEGPLGNPGNRPDHPGTPDGVSRDAVDLRAELAASIRPSAFPADKRKLLAAARDEHAPRESVALIERLPEGVSWESLEQVWEAAGGPPAEHRG